VPVRCAYETRRPCENLVLRTLGGYILSRGSYLASDGSYSATLTNAAIRRVAANGENMKVRLEMRDRREGEALVQRPAVVTLRVEPEGLARLRRCVRVRSAPATAGCPE
jgi:hypothetical protein